MLFHPNLADLGRQILSLRSATHFSSRTLYSGGAAPTHHILHVANAGRVADLASLVIQAAIHLQCAEKSNTCCEGARQSLLTGNTCSAEQQGMQGVKCCGASCCSKTTVWTLSSAQGLAASWHVPFLSATNAADKVPGDRHLNSCASCSSQPLEP